MLLVNEHALYQYHCMKHNSTKLMAQHQCGFTRCSKLCLYVVNTRAAVTRCEAKWLELKWYLELRANRTTKLLYPSSTEFRVANVSLA